MNTLFFLRPSKTPGHGTVYCRITLNGKRLVSASTSIKIHADDWDESKKRVKARCALGSLHNARLNAVQTALDTYLVYCELHGAEPSQARLNDIVVRGKFDAPTLLECFDRYLGVVEVQNSKGTYDTYRVRRLRLSNFLRETRQTKLMPEQFSEATAEKYRVWMLKTCGRTYAAKNLQVVKGLLAWARKEGYARFNPLHDYRIRVPYEKKLVSLTVEELVRMETAIFATERLQRVADCYLFSCYTGLAYADLKALTSTSFSEVAGRWVLRVARRKTGTEAFIPLPARAVALWQKYGSARLPVLSNSGFNASLKAVADWCKIDKPLTVHTARKTFAMHKLNVQGYRSEAVAKMLGHSSINQLRPYAFTQEDMVFREFLRVEADASIPPREGSAGPSH